MQYLQSRIVLEEPEPDNPFAARAAYCSGYDVYGEMLGRATWADMTYLLFRGDAPLPAQAAALDVLAVALGNAGPRDPAVHAAMCAGVGGSTAAASLNDHAYGMVMHGQRLAGAEPIAYELTHVDFRMMAESMAIAAYTVESPADFEQIHFDDMLVRRGPTLIDVRIDREEVPPMTLRLKTLGTLPA